MKVRATLEVVHATRNDAQLLSLENLEKSIWRSLGRSGVCHSTVACATACGLLHSMWLASLVPRKPLSWLITGFPHNQA
ncbi:hypothetical protein JCGZ_03662 [Jatropha curcas]|uniref:Uncharacterized protein n=1 Tax=Jatropha curcas TaxID=180498 RepID=A0A067JCR8_JATCU|nr:hypothetical protein JCGZ_03662 [Jatropha curcas]